MRPQQFIKLSTDATAIQLTLKMRKTEVNNLLKEITGQCAGFNKDIQELQQQINLIKNGSSLYTAQMQNLMSQLRSKHSAINREFVRICIKPIDKIKSDLDKQEKVIREKCMGNLNILKAKYKEYDFKEIETLLDNDRGLLAEIRVMINNIQTQSNGCETNLQAVLQAINQIDIPYSIEQTRKQAQKMITDLNALSVLCKNTDQQTSICLMLLPLRAEITHLQYLCENFVKQLPTNSSAHSLARTLRFGVINNADIQVNSLNSQQIDATAQEAEVTAATASISLQR